MSMVDTRLMHNVAAKVVTVWCDNLANPCHGRRFVWGCNLPTLACAHINLLSQPAWVHKPMTIPIQALEALLDMEGLVSNKKYCMVSVCFVTHSFARRSYCAGQMWIYSLTLYWVRFIFQHKWVYPVRGTIWQLRGSHSCILFAVHNHQSCKLGPEWGGQAAQGTSGKGGREKERKLSSEVASLVQLSLKVASLAQLSSDVTSLAQLWSSLGVTG
jgi:hypothetical protein